MWVYNANMKENANLNLIICKQILAVSYPICVGPSLTASIFLQKK